MQLDEMFNVLAFFLACQKNFQVNVCNIGDSKQQLNRITTEIL